MAAANGQNEDQNHEEMHLSLLRLRIIPNYTDVPSYESFNSSVAGVGLRALRDIPYGFRIISEPELFSIVKDTRVNRNQANFAEFQALSCPDPTWTADRTFEANSFGMGNDARGREIQGIFPTSARLNHSCIQNAYFAWNEKSRRLTVHALVNIPEGKEILVDYRCRNYLRTGNQRRQELHQDYGFDCTCPACDPEQGFGVGNEERRRQMRNLKSNIKRNKDASQPNVRNRRLANIETFIILLDQEGLVYPQKADLLKKQIKWYYKELERWTIGVEHMRFKERCIGDALRAARRKLDLDVACNGHDSPEVEKTLALIGDLKQQDRSYATEAMDRQRDPNRLRGARR